MDFVRGVFDRGLKAFGAPLGEGIACMLSNSRIFLVSYSVYARGIELGGLFLLGVFGLHGTTTLCACGGGKSTLAIIKSVGCAGSPDVGITHAEGQEVNHFSNQSDHNVYLVGETVEMSPREHCRRLQIGQIPMSSSHTCYIVSLAW